MRSVSVKVQLAKLTMILFSTGASEQGPESAASLRSLKTNQSFQCGHHFSEIVRELVIGRCFCLEQSFTKIPQNKLFSNSLEYGL